MFRNPTPLRPRPHDRSSAQPLDSITIPVRLDAESLVQGVKAVVTVENPLSVSASHRGAPATPGKAARARRVYSRLMIMGEKTGGPDVRVPTGQSPDVALVALNSSGVKKLKLMIASLRDALQEAKGPLTLKGSWRQGRTSYNRVVPPVVEGAGNRSPDPDAGAGAGADRASPAGTDQPGIPPDAFKPSAKARARLRGLEIIAQDLRKADGTFDLEEARAALMGISRQAIHEKVQKNQILAVPGPGNQRRYPAFQFLGGRVLPALDKVLAVLPSTDPWFRLHWLVNPDDRLRGRTPVELLHAGEVEPVLEAARRYGEMGA